MNTRKPLLALFLIFLAVVTGCTSDSQPTKPEPEPEQALFGRWNYYVVGTGPKSVFSADLDGDGDNDLAVTSPPFDVIVLLNRSVNASTASVTGQGELSTKVPQTYALPKLPQPL